MADPQHILCPSPEARDFAAPLFGGSQLVMANGSWPEIADPRDVIIVGPDADWVAGLCAIAASLKCPKIRFAHADLLQVEGKPLEWLRDRLQPYHTVPKSAAPQPKPPSVNSPVPESAKAAAAELDGGSDSPPDWHTDIPDDYPDERSPTDRVRMASNVVHLRSVETGAEWPEPEEQFSETSALPEFDQSWIAPPGRDFVRNIHDMQGCDIGIPAMHFLTVCAGLIPETIQVCVRKSQEWFESPRIWSCVLGRSGDGKSPAMRAITKEVKVLWTEIAEVSKTRMAAYKLNMEVYEAQKRLYVNAKSKGEPHGPVPIAPERPIDEQIYFDSTNVEAIADVLQGSSRGSMMLNDEILGFLMGFNQYRQGNDRQFFLEAFDGGRRVFNRVGRVWILDSGLSLCGNSQPGAFQRAMANMALDSDGLIQRVLIYNSLRDAETMTDAPADHIAIKRWRKIAHGLYHLKAHLEACYFSPKAQEIFRQAEVWISEVRPILASEPMQEHISKYRGYLARIALTLHCIDSADDGREAVQPEIQEDTIYRAWTFMRDCLFLHAQKFYGELASDTTRRRAMRQLTNFLICRPDMALTIRRRDFEIQCREAWYPETTAAARDSIRRELLNELIGMGWIRPQGVPDRIGKLPASFEINPRLDAKFSAVRAAELPKRQATRDRLEAQKAAKRERLAGED